MHALRETAAAVEAPLRFVDDETLASNPGAAPAFATLAGALVPAQRRAELGSDRARGGTAREWWCAAREGRRPPSAGPASRT